MPAPDGSFGARRRRVVEIEYPDTIPEEEEEPEGSHGLPVSTPQGCSTARGPGQFTGAMSINNSLIPTGPISAPFIPPVPVSPYAAADLTPLPGVSIHSDSSRLERSLFAAIERTLAQCPTSDGPTALDVAASKLRALRCHYSKIIAALSRRCLATDAELL